MAMLIEFNITNFRSIKGTQTLSFVADSAKELQEENTFSSELSQLPRLVKSAAIYGANAAGKSNLIRAIAFMPDFVKNSAKNCEEHINVKPFLLQPNNSPSEFEVIFIKEGMQYQYGFALTKERVIHEWLFANDEQWLERTYDPQIQEQNWFVSDKLISGMDLREQWKAATHYKALFLSTAKMLNSEEHSERLKSIFDWFTQTLTIFSGGSDILNSLTAKQCLDADYKQKIVAFLASADLNIVDLRVETQVTTEKDLPLTFPLEMKPLLGKKHIKFLHTDTNHSVLFDADDESEGTRKLFALAGPLIEILEMGHILVVDELNNSLHPTMMQFLIRLFHNQTLNKRGAQLIFTTHDSSILDETLLRRDQIWLIQKDSEQATQLYPFTDFKPRQNEAWQRDYLEGRYGALPSIVELTFNGN